MIEKGNIQMGLKGLGSITYFYNSEVVLICCFYLESKFFKTTSNKFLSISS